MAEENLESVVMEQLGPPNGDPDFHGFVMDRFRPSFNQDVHVQFTSTSTYWPFDNFQQDEVTDLQEAWPLVKSALEECGVSCSLDLVKRSISITFSQTKAKASTTSSSSSSTDNNNNNNNNNNPGAVVKAVCLVELLSIRVPAPQALNVLKGEKIDIIKTGNQIGGLRSQFAVHREDPYAAASHRRQLHSEAVQWLIGWGIFIKDDLFLVVGTSRQLKLARKIVRDRVVYGKHVSYRCSELIRLRLELNEAEKWNTEVGLARGEKKEMKTIKTGHQEGGLGSDYGINEDECCKRLMGLLVCKKEIGKMTGCGIFIQLHIDEVVVVGTSQAFEVVKRIVEDAIVRGEYPVSVDEVYQKQREALLSKNDDMNCQDKRRRI